MAINETAFWAVFMSGVVSAFLGSIFGLMLYPTFNQVIGEYAKYGSWGIGVCAAAILFAFTRYWIVRLLKHK